MKLMSFAGRGRDKSRGHRRARGGGGAAGLEPLELRRLMSVVATTPLPAVDVTSGTYPTKIDLDSYFSSTTISGTAVELSVTVGDTAGKIDLGLYDSAVPSTVTNFLRYVNSGAYNGSLFHKSATGSTTGSYVLGGGYYFPSGTALPNLGSVPSEVAQSPGYGTTGANVAGTIAMYKADGVSNQATSQFLINTADNSASSDLLNRGYTAFGRVLGDGMTLVNQINALPTEAFASPFDALPVTNYTSGTTLAQSNVVGITSARVVNAISYSAVSTAPELVFPTVASDGTLSLTYQPNVTGTANISVTATDLDGAVLTAQFTVTVSAGGNLSVSSSDGTRLDPSGPTTTSFGKIPVASGTQVTRTFTVQNTGSDTLDHISYSIADGGTGGFAVLNAPAVTLISGDKTTVTVRIDTSATGDKAGTLVISDADSGTPVLTVPMTANIQEQVVLGGKVTTLTYVQGSGAGATTATFKLGKAGTGTATFALTGAGLTATTKGSVVTVTGSAAADGIDFVNTALNTTLTLSSKGAAQVSLGTVTGVGTASLGSFAAKTAVLTGQLSWGSTTATSAQLKSLTLGTVSGAQILVGPTTGNPAFTFAAGTVTNSYVTVTNTIKSFAATTWNGGALVGQHDLASLTVKSGSVNTSMSLTGTLGTARIAGALSGGEWDLGGGIRSLSASSGASGFAISATGIVDAAKFAGDFSGTISAQAIGVFSAASGNGTTLVAKGTTDSSNVVSGGILKSIAFKGNVSAGYFSSANVVGTFSANAIDRCRLYAGVTIASNAVLPTGPGSFSGTGSEIGSVKLAGRGAANAYSLSVISAKRIVTASLGSVLASSGASNGLAASEIDKISATVGGRKVSASRITTQVQAAALLATLPGGSDFGITILS